jgi:K+-transporting ATPase ATPase C chain
LSGICIWHEEFEEKVMKENLRIALLMTLVTTVIFGVLYPIAATGLAQLVFPAQANGSLLTSGGKIIGSKLLGQSFSAPGYFHTRPSAAGDGYDANSSGGSNLGPTNHQLLERVNSEVQKLHAENPGTSIPADLVTSSASGLDPDISPAAAYFQIPRIARERHISETDLRNLIDQRIQPRQLAVLGELRINVLELNLALDSLKATR